MMKDQYEKIDIFFKEKSILEYIVCTLSCFFLILFTFFIIDSNIQKCNKIFFLILCAFLQIILQSYFFLGINIFSKKFINLSLIFTFCIILILLFSSLWIMYNLNIHMMDVNI